MELQGQMANLTTQALEQWARWTCEECDEGQRSPMIPEVKLCYDCERKDRYSRDDILRRAGCPVRYRRISFIEPDSWPEVRGKFKGQSLRKWTGDPWSVLFVGDVGTGKTMLATEMLYRLLRGTSRSGLWARAEDIIREVYGARGQERVSVWSRYKNAGVLLIDDLGHGHTGMPWQTIGELVAARWDAMKSTIFTTNRKWVEIEEEDPPTADRLRDGLVIGMRGTSRR